MCVCVCVRARAHVCGGRARLAHYAALVCCRVHAACRPQVLVYHDLLGMMQHPHHAKVTPKFCKQYSAVGAVIQQVGAAPAGWDAGRLVGAGWGR